jgi:hypothetical protein
LTKIKNQKSQQAKIFLSPVIFSLYKQQTTQTRMMFPYARRILLLPCIIISLLSPSSHAWSIRLNSQGQPRLCSVVAASLNGITRIGLGNANNANNGKKQVVVTAKSNRDVLQGKFQQISISLKNNQSPWLTMDQLDIKGENLQFGYTPIFIPLLCTILFRSPSLVLLFPLIKIMSMDQRQRIMMMEYYNSQPNVNKICIRLVSISILFRYQSLAFLLLFSETLRNQRIRLMTKEYLNYEYIKQTTETTKRSFQRLKRLLWKIIGGEPCQFNYELTLNNDNIAQSSLIRLFTKSILQSFMANSALPLAAAATDATNQLLKEVEDQQQQQQSATINPISSGSIISSNNNNNNNNAMSVWKENESSSFQLSKLLSATSFDLQGDPTFGKGGYVYLPCVALLPNDQGNLSFTLRTKVRALRRGKWGNTSNGLEFEAPASRVDVDAALPSNTNDWTRKFLPNVIWLPIGSPGMVLPLGRDTSIERINMNDERCQVQGQVRFFQENDKTTSSLTSI